MGAYFASGVLAMLSAFALLTSYSAFRTPKLFAERLGFDLAGADGLNEVRAQYGGFYLVVGIVGALALVGRLPLSSGLLLMTVIFGGLVLGRFVSLVLDGGWSKYRRDMIRALFLIDSLGVVVSGTALTASLS